MDSDAARAPSPSHGRRRLVLGTRIVAVVYPVALIAAAVILHNLGDRWWIATIVLYLPRVVFAVPLPLIVGALFALGDGRWLATQLPSLFVVLFPLLGVELPWPRSFVPSGPKIRVLSYNVNSGDGGPDRIVAEIDRFSPDIVVLQETGDTAPFEALLRTRFATVDAGEQFVMATRYMLVSAAPPDKVTFGGHPRSPRFRRYFLETPLGAIALYDVHPVSPREDFAVLRGPSGFRYEVFSGRVFSGAAAPVVESNAAFRAVQVATFAEAAAHENVPVVIAGDTNLPGLSPLIAKHLSGFVDGFPAASWGLGYTYPNNRWPWMRIDRIFASDNLRFVTFQVGDSTASDHRCVVADLQKR